MNLITLHITGMTCASCAKLIEHACFGVSGVQSVHVNVATNKAEVQFDESKTNQEAIIQAIQSAGYGATLHSNDHENHLQHDNDGTTAKRRFIGSVIFTLPIFTMMFEVNLMTGIMFLGVDLSDWIFAGLTAIVVFVFGFHFHKSAFKKLLHLAFNMDSLVSMGTLTAFVYSVWAMLSGHFMYFEAAATIITLINLGKWLEALSKGKASEAMKKLLELGAKNARVIRNGKEEEIPVDEIQLGDVLHVKAGEKIALDGIILEGSASIDESMLTGESLPQEKQVGNEVFAGTINQNGSIKIRVTKASGDTLLSQIVKMVESAQMSKAPIQKLADTISGIFVPVVLGIAGLTFCGWFLFTKDITTSILPAVAVLVIACPCALGLATPTAIMIGTASGAKNGILIKNGETLEKSNSIDVVVFDKTGTLTEGKPKVTDVIVFEFSENEVLALAASLAALSHHPLSQAIAHYAKEKSISLFPVQDFQEVSGKGVKGTIQISNNKYQITETSKQDFSKLSEFVEVKLGNQKFIEQESRSGQLTVPTKEQLDTLSSQGKTAMLVAVNEKTVGIIAVIDTIKPDAEQAVLELQKRNIEVIMMSGDKQKTAETIANELKISQVIAEVLPQDKAREVQKLQMLGKKVAFVGDGINDAPALVQADLGIAIGTGSDIAIETGNIILMQGNPQKVIDAILLSQKTFKIIKQNLFWAFIYNIVGIPIAALGLLNPIFASFAMSLSSVSVILNSLRIRK